MLTAYLGSTLICYLFYIIFLNSLYKQCKKDGFIKKMKFKRLGLVFVSGAPIFSIPVLNVVFMIDIIKNKRSYYQEITNRMIEKGVFQNSNDDMNFENLIEDVEDLEMNKDHIEKESANLDSLTEFDLKPEIKDEEINFESIYENAETEDSIGGKRINLTR